MSVRLIGKGQATIPKLIRDPLGLHARDQLEFVIVLDGRVTLRPVTIDVMDLAGCMRQKGKRALSLEEMRRGILKGATRQTR